MGRNERQAIRLAIAKKLDLYCRICQYFSESNKQCVNCPVGIEMKSLSNRLENVCNRSISKVQPISMDDIFVKPNSKRRPWTEEEDFYLINHSRLYPNEHLAKKLNRSVTAVNSRITKLRKGVPHAL